MSLPGRAPLSPVRPALPVSSRVRRRSLAPFFPHSQRLPTREGARLAACLPRVWWTPKYELRVLAPSSTTGQWGLAVAPPGAARGLDRSEKAAQAKLQWQGQPQGQGQGQAIELFAGAGGLGIGISQAGFTPLKIVEWDRWCCDTIRENRARGVSAMKSWPEPTEGDVRDTSFKKYAGKVELITGGPPCQPFSLGGKHGAHNDERDMWSEAVRVVREVRPKAFIFENVKGLTRESFSSYLAYIVQQLTYPGLIRRLDENWEEHLGRLERHHTGRGHGGELNYRVVYRVLNAANYGIPQRRERVVFVGFRSDLGVEWSFPEETHSLDALLSDQTSGEYWERHGVLRKSRAISPRFIVRATRLKEKPRLLPWRTVRDAIGDLPDPELEPMNAAAFRNHKFQPGARTYAGHTGSPMDEPAKTLKAGVHGVPGGENMLSRADGSVRYFTVRESARLQTFPDQFVFHGAWSEAMRQLGNAVPVELAAVIARNVGMHLDAVARIGRY